MSDGGANLPAPGPTDTPQHTVVVRLRVPGQMTQLDANGMALRRGDTVIIESERGPSPATILMEPEPSAAPRDLPKVLRLATEDDQRIMDRNRVREQEAFGFCQERIRALAQPMKLVAVELAHTGTRATFYFTSGERVDFRNLVKNLARRFHTRIEMRQIGVRDAARHTGGIGVCGRELCCSTWLPSFKPISIRMAKDQNLALNHDKLSGVCGRLRCCLRYEQEIYQQSRKGMPKLGKRVITPEGEGRVRDLNILKRRVGVILADGAYAEFDAEAVSRPPDPQQRARPPRELEREVQDGGEPERPSPAAANEAPTTPGTSPPDEGGGSRRRRRRGRRGNDLGPSAPDTPVDTPSANANVAPASDAGAPPSATPGDSPPRDPARPADSPPSSRRRRRRRGRKGGKPPHRS